MQNSFDWILALGSYQADSWRSKKYDVDTWACLTKLQNRKKPKPPEPAIEPRQMGEGKTSESWSHARSWSRKSSYVQYALDVGAVIGLASFLHEIAEINVLYGLVAYMTVRLGIAYIQELNKNSENTAYVPEGKKHWPIPLAFLTFGSAASAGYAFCRLLTTGMDVGTIYWLMGSVVLFMGSLLATEYIKEANNPGPGQDEAKQESNLLSQISTALGFLGPIATMTYGIVLRQTNTGDLASKGAWLAMAAGGVLFFKFIFKGIQDRYKARALLNEAKQDPDGISSSNDLIGKMVLSGALFACAALFIAYCKGGENLSLTNTLVATVAGVLSGFLFSSAYAYENQSVEAAAA